MDVANSATDASHRTVTLLRRALLAIFLLSAVGTSAELLLLDHIEDAWQLVPLGLFGLSVIVLASHAVLGRAAIMRLFQLTMILFLIAGIIGMVLHYQAKSEFAEVDPSLSGMDLFRAALKGKVPPVLAPGIMIQLGLLGLAWTWRHPSLAKTAEPPHTRG